MSIEKILSKLNNEFAIQGRLKFVAGSGDFVLAKVNSEQCQATIAIQGAQLLSWMPKDQQPVIWLSDDAKYIEGKAIRGGIPVCWPWFGAYTGNNDFPSHGFARTSLWNVIGTDKLGSGEVMLRLSLPHKEEHRQYWSHLTELELQIVLGSELRMSLITRNRGNESITLSQALHTYFTVSDISKVQITNLEQIEFIDALDDWQRKVEAAPIKINAEIDRIYQNTRPSCVIKDSGFQRQIKVTTERSASTVVWNPWIDKSSRLGDMGENGYLKMVCVESGNIAEHSVQIGSGEEHSLSVYYQIEPM